MIVCPLSKPSFNSCFYFDNITCVQAQKYIHNAHIQVRHLITVGICTALSVILECIRFGKPVTCSILHTNYGLRLSSRLKLGKKCLPTELVEENWKLYVEVLRHLCRSYTLYLQINRN